MSSAIVHPAATATRVPDRPQLIRWANLLEQAVDLIDTGDHLVSDRMYATARTLVDQVSNEMYGAHQEAARAAWGQALERGRTR